MKRFLLVFALLLYCIPAPVLAQETSRETLTEFNLFDLDAEVLIGDANAVSFEAEHAFISMPEVEAYLKSIVDRLLEASPISSPPEFVYRFHIIDYPVKKPNAQVKAGGHIFVNLIMLNAVRNEDELAGVLAHEIGHIVLRHVTRRWTALIMIDADPDYIRHRHEIDAETFATHVLVRSKHYDLSKYIDLVLREQPVERAEFIREEARLYIEENLPFEKSPRSSEQDFQNMKVAVGPIFQSLRSVSPAGN